MLYLYLMESLTEEKSYSILFPGKADRVMILLMHSPLVIVVIPTQTGQVLLNAIIWTVEVGLFINRSYFDIILIS